MVAAGAVPQWPPACADCKQAVKVIFTVKNGAVDTVLGVVSDADIVTEGLIGDIGDVDTTNKEVEIDDVDYKLEGSSVTYAEFKVGVAEDYLDAEKDDAYVFQAIDNNDNGRIDVIVYYPFDVAQIEYLSSTSIKMTGITNTDLDDVNLYTGAEEDDWVVVTAAKNACDETMSVVKADVITGEVSSTKTNGDTVEEILVDGTWYNVSEKCTGDDLVLNTKFDLVVVNGYVFNADETEGNVAADNILYVDDAAALSTGLTNAVEAKVYFADGTSATVKVTELDDNDIVATPKKDKDEITPAKAAEGMENNLYTFTEKNGEYALETVDNNNKGSFDAYNIITSGTVKDGKVGSIRFAENAVIFVEDADGVKVVTGKTIANWGETSITSLQYLANTTNGVLYTEIGAIVMDGVAKTDMGAYGFVTSSITNTKDSDGTAYLNFTMWDGKESVPVKVEAKDLDVTIAKYSFVSFDWAAEGEADADSVIVKTVSGDARPITAFVLGDTITQNGVSKLNTWDFADDYVIIGVDTKNGKGVDSAALKVAKEVPGSNPVELYSNTVIFTVKDGDKDVVEAVFVDINGAMYLDGVAQSIDKIVPEA